MSNTATRMLRCAAILSTAMVGVMPVVGLRALRDGVEVIGRVLRTQDDVKPVFVSAGHRMDLETACSLTLRLAPRFRLPETTRAADRACRDAVS